MEVATFLKLLNDHVYNPVYVIIYYFIYRIYLINALKSPKVKFEVAPSLLEVTIGQI